MKKKWIIISCVVIVGIIGSIVGYKVYKKVQYNKAISNLARLDAINHRAGEQFGKEYRNDVEVTLSGKHGHIVGEIQNGSPIDIQSMYLTISLYNDDNGKIGEQTIMVGSLSKYSKFTVDETILYKNTSTFKVTEKYIIFVNDIYN